MREGVEGVTAKLAALCKSVSDLRDLLPLHAPKECVRA